MAVAKNLSHAQLNDAIKFLSDLSKGEFNCDLDEILNSQDEEIAIKRIGRLISVTIKEPFAKSFPYDPDLPWNWAKSNRAWEILGPIPPELKQKHPHHYQFLSQVSENWQRPEYKIAEWHVFNFICKKIRPIICNESKTLEETNRIAEELKESGTPVSTFTTSDLTVTSSAAIATWLSTTLNIPNELLPIIAGTTLLLCVYGKNRLCNFLIEFKESQENNPNPFENYPQCGSTKTFNGEPCGNEVLKEGDYCWKHKE